MKIDKIFEEKTAPKLIPQNNTKIISPWNRDLKVKRQSYKAFIKNIGEYLCNNRMGEYFLN